MTLWQGLSFKAALAGVFAWMDENWSRYAGAAILAFCLGITLMVACEGVESAVKQMLQ